MRRMVWTVGFLTLSLAMWAGDFWKDKKPEEWSASEVQAFLGKSPWAKTVELEYNQIHNVAGSLPGPTGRDGGTGTAALPGDGGDIVERTHSRGTPAIVRWGSAPLVRAACAKAGWTDFNATVANYAKSYYVISVTMPEKTRAPWQKGPTGRETKEEADERLRGTQERMLQSASLKCGRKSVRPDRVEYVNGTQGRVSLYLFPRSPALETNDCDVDFFTAPAPMVIRAKFKLKDMRAAEGL